MIMFALLCAGCDRSDENPGNAIDEYARARSLEVAGIREFTSRVVEGGKEHSTAEVVVREQAGERSIFLELVREGGVWKVVKDLDGDFAKAVFEGGEREIARRMLQTVAEKEGAEIEATGPMTKRYRLMHDRSESPMAEIEIAFSCKNVKLGSSRKGVYLERYIYEPPLWKREGSRIFFQVD